MSTKAERREARQRRQRRRLRKRREQNRLLERFGEINWEAYEHRMMWNMVKSARPAEMGGKAFQWADLAAKADAATDEVRKTAQRLLMSWRGQSAVTAAGSISELTKWGARASGTARTVGDRLDTYTSVVQEARRRMPEPVHPTAEAWFKEGKDVSVLDGPNGAYMLEQLLDDHEPTRKEQQRKRQEAVEVMQSYEGSSRGVHDSLPQFDGPPPTTVDPGTKQPRPPDDGGDPPTPISPLPGDPSPSTPPGGWGSDPSLPPGTTTASSTTGLPGFPGSGVPGGAGNVYGQLPGGGQAGFGASPGGGAAAGGGFGSAPGGGPGGAMFGAGGQTGAGAGSGSAAAAAQRAAAGVGGRGGSGFGMMPPGGAGGQRGDEDSEHQNKYGVGIDLMDDLPPAYPAVFGDD